MKIGIQIGHDYIFEYIYSLVVDLAIIIDVQLRHPGLDNGTFHKLI